MYHNSAACVEESLLGSVGEEHCRSQQYLQRDEAFNLVSPCAAAVAAVQPVQSDTPIQEAIQACCTSLGRKPGPAEADLVSPNITKAFSS